MQVVLDTNVVVNHWLALDVSCSAAINSLKGLRHTLVVCEKLLREYRGVMASGDRQMYALVDHWLLQVIPVELMRKCDDPVVKISFGPPEDRFHMQLAIDAPAEFHVTRDQAVLNEAANMGRFGVRETTPRGYVYECRH